MLRALQDRRFARNAQVSPHKGGYRHLADFPEFKAALDLLKDDAPASATAAAALPDPPVRRRRWLQLLLTLLVLLAVSALGFWLGQLLAR